MKNKKSSPKAKNSEVVSFRVEAADMAALSKYAAELSRLYPGVSWSSGSAAKNLVLLALREREK